MKQTLLNILTGNWGRLGGFQNRLLWLLEWWEIVKNKRRLPLIVTPEACVIEITNICNSTCTICPHRIMTRKQAVMDESLFRRIVDICHKEGIQAISFGGLGEPFCDKGIVEKARYVVDSGLILDGITTNGQLCRKEVVVELVKLGLKRLLFSVDSADKERYESIRQGLSFETVVKNIRDCLELSGCEISINAVTNDKSEREKFLELFKSHNVIVTFSPFHNWGDMIKPNHRLYRTYCGRVFGSCVLVRVDGTIPLCVLDYDNKQPLGILNGSLSAAWNNEVMMSSRLKHIQGRWDDIDICVHCTDNYFGRPQHEKVLIK